MKRRLSVPSDRAAYHASQPLFDALRNGCEKSKQHTSDLEDIRDQVQRIHMKVDKADALATAVKIFRSWQCVQSLYDDTFKAMADLYESEPGIIDIDSMFLTACVSHARSLSEGGLGGKLATLLDLTEGQTLKHKIEEIATKHNVPLQKLYGGIQAGEPSLEPSPEQDNAVARDRLATNEGAAGPAMVPVPIPKQQDRTEAIENWRLTVEHQDMTEEVKARLHAKKEKKEKKTERGKGKKRKRTSGASDMNVTEPAATTTPTERPSAKKAKVEPPRNSRETRNQHTAPGNHKDGLSKQGTETGKGKRNKRTNADDATPGGKAESKPSKRVKFAHV